MNFAEFFSQVSWRPRIGDPSVMGWITVIAYAAAAVLCFVAASRQPGTIDSTERRRRYRSWIGVGFLMAFLCVNKQLDLQSLVTDVGRILARQEGWYGARRIVQRWFVLAVAVAGTAALAFFAWKIRAVLRERIILLVGLTGLLSFIIIRAASFHHVDVLIGSRIAGLRVNWIMELGGISLVAVGALRAVFGPRPK
jgi:hypothetical protein